MDVDILGNIPLFAKLSPDELKELASLLQSKTIEAQKPVVWIGDPGSDFYIIQVGRASVCFPDEAGHEVTIATLGPGDFFGEISLLDGGPRTATVRAQNELLLVSLSRHDFLEFLKRHPTAGIHILTVLGQRQREMLEKLRGVKNVNEVFEEKVTRWQKIADIIAAVSASPQFVVTHLVWFAGWMMFNAFMGGPDPYPYPLLTMIVSLEAIFLSIFVLVSQNRSGEKDRIHADLDYQVNLKAHLEVMQLHQKIGRIENTLDALAKQAGVAVPARGGAAPTSASERLLAMEQSENKS